MKSLKPKHDSDIGRSQSRPGSSAFNDPAIMSSVPYNPGAGDNNINVQINKGAYPPNLGYGGVQDTRFALNPPPGLQSRNVTNGQLSMPPNTAAISAPFMTSPAGFNVNHGHQCKSSHFNYLRCSCIVSHALQREGYCLKRLRRGPAKSAQYYGWIEWNGFFILMIDQRF